MKTPYRRTWWLPPSQRAERDEQIREKWALGWTAREIAKVYDITPQRVGQIVRYR